MTSDDLPGSAVADAAHGHVDDSSDRSGNATGLSRAEAALRLQRDGPNELSPPRRRTRWRIALEVAAEPMFQLLVAAALIYLLLGDLGEASMLLAFVVVTAVITLVQEHRTERVLEALRDLTSPRALVLRDGRAERIAGRDVVQGDLLLLNEGDRVAADARLLSANDLKADESLLTGEALPVAKAAAPGSASGEAPVPRPGSAGSEAIVYAGTMVVDGQGLALVQAIGARSEIGRIGKTLDAVVSPPTPLQMHTRRLVRIFSLLGLGLSVLLVLLYGLARGDWLAGLLAGITLAMATLPEEFPLILTVFMAMGAWRMSRQRVLTRRATTIEALGAATVLCSDKTGTLTRNRMAIAELAQVPELGEPTVWRAGAGPLPTALQPLLEFGILASERDPFDAMEQAFHALGREQLQATGRHDGWTLEHEYGLAPSLMAMTHAWRAPGAAVCTVAIKGAPEAVAALCHLPAATQQAAAAAAQSMAVRGHRVLAVASAQWPGKEWPATPHGFDFDWLGLVALADPLRDGVPAAVQQCRDAGIRVVMITGDHPATARAIATQAGLATGGDVLAGPELAALDAAELRRRVASADVFARVLPEQKLRIVEALKANGEVVAMTGDGVNDAPSLKAAHIGIAMGGRGTDVAREASSLVLLDDDFGSIVQAIRLGRRTYDNLRKAMAFVFAVHVPIAGLSLMPLLFGLPLVFKPVHIAFLELVIDPVCSIAFEAESDEADVMARPPRDPAAPLFSLGLVGWSLAQGALLLAAVTAFFVGLLHAQVPEAQARAAAFTALVACNAVLIIVNRSFAASLLAALRRPNPLLWAMLAGTAALLTAALAVPPLRRLFLFAPLSPSLLAAAMALALAVWLALAALKRVGQPLSSRRAA